MMRNGNLVDVKWKPRNVTITTPKNTLGNGFNGDTFSYSSQNFKVRPNSKT